MASKSDHYYDADNGAQAQDPSRGHIPGISEARELQDGDSEPEQDAVEDGDEAKQQHASDAEAHFKNLSFQGVPNSALKGTEHDEKDEQVTWLKKMNRQESFSGWRKEVGQALRRFSKLTSRKNGRNEPTKGRRQSIGHVHNAADAYAQNLASDLIDTLISGCPAALFAGSSFLRDEHGVRRAPLLLAMLGVKVSPSSSSEVTSLNITRQQSESSSEGPGHLRQGVQNLDVKFKLELEYGVGYNRMKWSVVKSYKDLAALHSKLKLAYVLPAECHKQALYRPSSLPTIASAPFS